MSSTFNHRKGKWSKRDGRIVTDLGKHTRRLQDKKEAVQERTFTKWINMHLKRCDPPLQVHDLFTDVQDGKILMILLEELSGCNMLDRFRPFPHRIFRLNNISKVLNFLEDRNVSLINIDANDIADGNPSVVLRLIWNIIVYYQVKQVTGNLERNFSSTVSLLSLPCGSDSSCCSSPTPPGDDTFGSPLASKGKRSSQNLKYRGTAIKTLLSWTQNCTAKYGVEIHDFGKSWRSGLAFLALVKSFCPEFVDIRKGLSSEPRLNMETAFTVAHEQLGIPPLLALDDIAVHSPDEQCVITYVAQFLECCPGHDMDDASTDSSRDTPNSIERWDSSWAVSASCVLSSKISLEALTGLHNISETNQEDSQYLTSTCFRSQEKTYHTPQPCSQSLPITPMGLDSVSEHFHPMKSSNRIHGQSLSDSTRGQCCDFLECMKSRVDYRNCSEISGQGVFTMSVLDSDEEDAYSYILDLDHKEAGLDSASNADIEFSAIMDAHGIDFDLNVASTCDSQGNGINNSFCHFCETQRHLVEMDILMRSSNENNILVSQRKCDSEETSPPDPEQHDYGVNINASHSLVINQIGTNNPDKTVILSSDEHMDFDLSSKMNNIHSDNFSDGASVQVENGLDKATVVDDHCPCVVKDSILNSLLDNDPYEQISVSNQSLVDRKTGEHTVSQTPREVEGLHMLLFLWMITYCIFMCPQLDIFSLLNPN
ncbi:uncharacterized protein LOC127410110 isoform X2 [Myxocyprinus asiaticus]|nr:uncharacterized protein LOC127410110 isoform X2 [Myxocyprinus asiaticus]